MQRVIATFLLIISLSGCSSTRKTPNLYPFTDSNEINNVNDLTQLNLTRRNFDIQKIEILFKNREGEETFMANLKFRLPNEYLVSIRTKIGIEVARINIKNDSIFIIDKINNVLYKGSDSYFKRNFGLSMGLIPLMVGDVLVNKKDEPNIFQCTNDPSLFTIIGDTQINYLINCQAIKPETTAILDSYNRATLFNYSFQKSTSQFFLLDEINVSSEYYGYWINVDYDNYQFDPLSSINFNTSDINNSINLE